MVIYFLQVVWHMPCLPVSECDGSDDIPEAGCVHLIERPHVSELPTLMFGFLEFYARKFIWGTEVVSMHLGRRTQKDSHMVLRGRWMPRLHIEDPILTDRNLNASLWLEQEEALKEAMVETQFREERQDNVVIDGGLAAKEQCSRTPITNAMQDIWGRR